MRSIDLLHVSELGYRSSMLDKQFEHSHSSRIDHSIRNPAVCLGLYQKTKIIEISLTLTLSIHCVVIHIIARVGFMTPAVFQLSRLHQPKSLHLFETGLPFALAITARYVSLLLVI